jgi:hypothetical protein
MIFISIAFRVSEKVSTPTSVVLMAINTCIGEQSMKGHALNKSGLVRGQRGLVSFKLFHFVGFFWRQLMTDSGAEAESWNYLAVCVPIVVLFGPLGSFLASHFHRQVLAVLIYVLDTIALVRFILGTRHQTYFLTKLMMNYRLRLW